ncbi:hypothetical protein U1Q18_001426, partial [Sarracenia purpurea var. burkii]
VAKLNAWLLCPVCYERLGSMLHQMIDGHALGCAGIVKVWKEKQVEMDNLSQTRLKERSLVKRGREDSFDLHAHFGIKRSKITSHFLGRIDNEI